MCRPPCNMRSTLLRGSEPPYLQVGASVTRYQSCTVDPRPARVIHCPDLNACLVDDVHCNAVHYGYAVPVNVVPLARDPQLAELVLDTDSGHLSPETVEYLLRHHPQLRDRPKDMATMANHRGRLSEPEEDIAAIAKQISDHAEAIYQTWKSRGLAPTEILNCHTNSTAADKFGSALTPQREQQPVVDLLSTPSSLNTNNLEQLVNNFVVEDKARIARQKTNTTKAVPSSIQFALQKFEKKGLEQGDAMPKQINQRQNDSILRNYSNSSPKPFQAKPSNVSPYIMDTIANNYSDNLAKQTTEKIEEGSSGMTTWPLKTKTVGDTIKKLGGTSEPKTEHKYSTMPKSSGAEYLDEVAKEEERLINALKTGIIIAEDPASKRIAGKKTTGLLQKKLKDKPHVNASDAVDFGRKTDDKVNELKQVLNKVNVQSKVEAFSKVEAQQPVTRRSAPGGSVPHPELRRPASSAAATNPVRPFLTRGSVAERVLIFEKCPTELIMEKRTKGPLTSWRNTSVDVQAKAQVSHTRSTPRYPARAIGTLDTVLQFKQT